jgi:hypothetical protein
MCATPVWHSPFSLFVLPVRAGDCLIGRDSSGGITPSSNPSVESPPSSPGEIMALDSPVTRPGPSPIATLFRPASAERRRWVLKMKQLEDGNDGGRATRALENDVDACRWAIR